MKELPKIRKIPLEEFPSGKVKPVIAGIVASVLAGSAIPGIAASHAPEVPAPANSPASLTTPAPQQPAAAPLLVRPTLDGQVFAAHYSHSSHASHASHYSCTPGSTC